MPYLPQSIKPGYGPARIESIDNYLLTVSYTVQYCVILNILLKREHIKEQVRTSYWSAILRYASRCSSVSVSENLSTGILHNPTKKSRIAKNMLPMTTVLIFNTKQERSRGYLGCSEAVCEEDSYKLIKREGN